MTRHTPEPLRPDAHPPQGEPGNDAIGGHRPASPTGNSRRRLLKAAAAAPAVLTLHSGAVQAASSALRCLQNPYEQPKRLFTLNKPKYHAWRMKPGKSFRCRKITVSEVVSDNGEILSTITPVLNASKMIIVNYGLRQGYRDASGARYEMTTINGNSVFNNSSSGEYYAIEGYTDRVRTYVYVDNDGNVQGTGPYHRMHGKAVFRSCYTSIHPRRT
jgi:hypothetical protein